MELQGLQDTWHSAPMGNQPMENLRLVQDPAPTAETIERHHRRFGLLLFAAYLFVYAGFIAIATFDHALLANKLMLGLNLAVLYGFGLIGLAFALALVFLAAGSNQDRAPTQSQKRG
jgi:uncharacterized membrane protein (DUF485 family)